MISELIINAFLVTIMLSIAIALIKTRTLIFTVILTSAYSLVAALMFITLDAVDVAFTEASVGAGISTILFLAAMAYLPKKEEENIGNQFVPALTCIILCAILIWCSYDLPQIGLVSSPIHQHIAPDYILGSRNDIGIPNIVTSVLASYRGYDTFGETIVVFTAGVAVLVLLQNSTPPSKKTKSKIKKKVGKNA
jgi:multicomponent Na+:H+ antiporter subunit B